MREGKEGIQKMTAEEVGQLMCTGGGWNKNFVVLCIWLISLAVEHGIPMYKILKHHYLNFYIFFIHHFDKIYHDLMLQIARHKINNLTNL